MQAKEPGHRDHVLTVARHAWRQLDPRRRAIWTALLSAVLVTPLSLYVAAGEWSAWSQHPPLARWAFVTAGLLSFATPYLVVALLVARRSASAAFAAVFVAWFYRVGVICLLSVPMPYTVGWILIPMALWVSPPTGKIITVAVIAALVAFFRLQSQLIRDGRALRTSAAPESSRSRKEWALAVCLPIAYALAWVASFAYPERADRARRVESARAQAAAHAEILERSRRAAGTPLEEVWQVDRQLPDVAMGVSTEGLPLAADSTSVYVAAPSALVALARSDGRVRWRIDSLQSRAPYPALTRATDGSTTVLASDTAGALYALAARDGRLLWHVRPVPAWHWESPAPRVTIAHDGSVYMGGLRYDQSLSVPLVHADADGTVRWRASIGHGLVSPIAVGSGDRIYAVGRGGTRLRPFDTLFAIGANGIVAWRRPLASGSPAGNIALDGRGEIAVGASDHVRIFSRRGDEIAGLPPAPAVYAAGHDGLLALDSTRLRLLRADGRGKRWTEIWSYTAYRIARDEHFVGNPILTPSGRVIVGTSSRVLVVRLSDGRLLAEYAPLIGVDDSGAVRPRFRWLSAPARGPDGMIYVAGEGAVDALRDTTSQR